MKIRGEILQISYDNRWNYYQIGQDFFNSKDKLRLKTGDKVIAEVYSQDEELIAESVYLEEYHNFIGLEGEITEKGKVINCLEYSTGTIFDISNQYDEKIRCFSSEKIKLLKGDLVIVNGIIETFCKMGTIEVYKVILHTNFCLDEYLLEYYSKKNIKDSKKVENAIEKIENYGFDFYGGVLNMAYHIFNDMIYSSEEQIETLSVFINESDEKRFISETKDLITKIAKEQVYRPFNFYGVSDETVDEILKSRRFEDAYKVLLTNPGYIIELTKEIVFNIEYLIKRKINEQEENISNVGRFIYFALTFKKWTSVPCSYLKRIFGENFVKFKEVMGNYLCEEYMDSIYYSRIRRIENYVSIRISSLIKTKGKVILDEEQFNKIEDEFEATDEQFQAIRNACNENISIITGGAGTGKTTIMNKVNNILKEKGFKPLFLAYVGAAVQRIKEALNDPDALAFTIHLAIKMHSLFVEDSITHVIFDECSMIDLELINMFFEKFSNFRKLKYAFVGDINQLEPISYGDLMANLLKCKIPITYLEKNFRSEEGILEVINSIIDKQRVNPINWGSYDFSDYEFYSEGRETLLQYIINLDEKIQRSNPRRKEDVIRLLDKITVVTYFRDAVQDVNNNFQRIFLQGFDNVTIDNKKFYEFDRVMNLKNNYSLNIMNGEIGKISEINANYVVVNFKRTETNYGIFAIYFSSQISKIFKKIVEEFKISLGEILKQEIGGEKTDDFFSVNQEPAKKAIMVTKIKRYREKFENASKEGYFTSNDVKYFFDLAERYPTSIFTDKGIQTPSLKLLDLAYCVTVRKAQGNQYNHCIVYHNGKYNFFLNKRVLYTEMSRAKKKLTVIATSINELNRILNTPEIYKHENLYNCINEKLPENLKTEIAEQQNDEDIPFDFVEDDYDDVDFDDIF